jgi:PTH2 family peptidyl-tRNA hydrolase
MYIVVNNSLKMGKGKAVAQAGHGVSKITEYMVKNDQKTWKEYKKSGTRKITVKADEEEFMRLKEIFSKDNRLLKKTWCHAVIDMGLTQIPEGSVTCLVFPPMKESQVPVELKQLKLY